MRDTILIAGDSWGVGEWGGQENKNAIWEVPISHCGLQYFLNESHQKVINLARPGSSNAETWYICQAILSNNPTLQESIRFLLVFQTEWQRDVCEHWHISEVTDYCFRDLKSRWVSRAYQRFSELSSKYNVPVYIIGGAGDTIWLDNFQQEYPGVTIVCQSLTNFLVESDHRINTPIMIGTHRRLLDSISQLKSKNLTQDDKEFILEELASSDDRLETWKAHPEWFYPDNTHANRHGHKKLFDYLSTVIPNFVL
jgi:hypothetical protein